MPISADELAARVNSLRLSYAQNLPDKLDQIAARIELLSVEWSDESGDEAARFAHNLAGTGQTFGFPEVGQAARRLEDELVTSKARRVVTPTLSDTFEELIRAAASEGVPVEAQ